MGKRITTAQRPCTLLVAGPSITTFTFQHFPTVLGVEGQDSGLQPGKDGGARTLMGALTWTTPNTPVRGSGTVTVAGNTFAGPTSLLPGKHVLTTGVDFAIGADEAETASNMAAAVDLLPEFAASATDEVVEILGPYGPAGNDILLRSTGASPHNFVASPDGSLSGAEPYIGPPVLG